MCHNVPLWAARGRYPSRPRSPTLLLIRWLGSSRSALSRLAWAHAHETLLWAGKRGSHHTFNYDLINSRSPSASRRRNHRWVMRLALPDGIMPPGQNIRWQEDGGSGDGTFVAVRGLRPAGWSSGAERLRLLNRVKWPTTEPLLEAAGLRAGMSCLDVGCGGGDVTLKMAALVGTEGHVVGVDRDQSVLQLARQESEEQGLPVTFRRLEAEELAEESAYDLVFARYLLSHLPRPQRAVTAMVRAARPGGRLVLEDVFFPGHICYPSNAAFDRFVELYQAVAREKEGGDAAIGVRLLGMALEAGLVDVRVGLVVPTFREGEGKWVTRVTMEHIRGAVVGAGLASDSEVDQVVSELGRFADDDRTLMSIAPTFQVWGRKAGA